MKSYIIYKLTFPSKRAYVGQTTNINRRFAQYKSKLVKRQPLLQSCLEKYNWDEIKTEILHSNLSKEEADSKEIEEIAKISDNCANLASGGSSGLCKPIIQFDLKGSQIKTWNNVLEICDYLGVPYTRTVYIGEICRNSNKVAGNRYKNYLWLYKNLYDSGQRPILSRVNPLVYKLDEIGNTIETYISCYEAAEKLEVSYMAIKQAIYRNQKCKGFYLKH